MSTEDEVRQASDQFYAALNRMLTGDARPMMEVWSHDSDVTTMHPIGGREVGWEQVRVPWEQVTLRDPLIRVVGDLAYQVGTEAGEGTLAGQQVSFEQRVHQSLDYCTPAEVYFATSRKVNHYARP